MYCRPLLAAVLLVASLVTVGARGGGLDPASLRVVDLSHAFDERTLYWPTAPSRFTLEQLSSGVTEGGWFYAANRFAAMTCSNTSVSMPRTTVPNI